MRTADVLRQIVGRRIVEVRTAGWSDALRWLEPDGTVRIVLDNGVVLETPRSPMLVQFLRELKPH